MKVNEAFATVGMKDFDTLCIDKTGTITDNTYSIYKLVPLINDPLQLALEQPNVVLSQIISNVLSRYDAIICEADGSKRLPLKVHTDRDPVIPEFATDTVSVTGLWGIGSKASEVSFGDDRDIVVDSDYLQWYIDNPQGLLKGSIKGHRTVLFNGADDCPDLSVLRALRYPEDVRVFACSEKEGKIYERIR